MESLQKVINCLLLQDIISLLPFKDQLNLRLVNKTFADEATEVLKKNSKLTIRLPYERFEECVKFISRLTRLAIAFTKWLPCKSSQPLTKSPQSLLSLANVILSVCLHEPKSSLVTFGIHYGPILRKVTLNFPSKSNESKDKVMSKTKTVLKYCTNLETLRLTLPCCWFKEPAALSSDLSSGRTSVLPRFEYLRHIEFIHFPTCFLGFANDILEASPNLVSVNVELYDAYVMPPCTGEFFSKMKSFGIVELKLDTLTLTDPLGERTLLKELIAANLKLKKVAIYIELAETAYYAKSTELKRGKEKLQEWLTSLTNLEKLEIRVFPNRTILKGCFPAVMPNLTTLEIGTFGNDGDYPYRGICNDYTRAFSGIVNFIPPLCQAQVPKMDTLVIGTNTLSYISSGTFQSVKKLVVKNRVNGMCQLSSLPDTSLWPRQFPNVTVLETYLSDENERSLIPIFQMKTLMELKIGFDLSSGKAKHVKRVWDIITGGIRPVIDRRMSPDLVIENLLSNCEEADAFPNFATSILNLRNLKILRLSTFISPAIEPFKTVFHAILKLTVLELLQPLEQLEIFVAECVHSNRSYLDGRAVALLKSYHDQVILTGPHATNRGKANECIKIFNVN